MNCERCDGRILSLNPVPIRRESGVIVYAMCCARCYADLIAKLGRPDESELDNDLDELRARILGPTP